jgi:hypothetical protein
MIPAFSVSFLFLYSNTTLLIHAGIYSLEDINFLNSSEEILFSILLITSVVVNFLPRYHNAKIANPTFDCGNGIFFLLTCFNVTSRPPSLNRRDCPVVKKMGCAGTITLLINFWNF